MPLIQWNQSLSVNVAEIDHQHQTLVGMINTLHDAMSQGKGSQVLGSTIAALIGYAATHFKTEETYFDQFRYPATDSHKAEHAAFAKTVTEFQRGFEAGELGLTIEVMTFLSEWLTHHIKDVDHQYMAWFNEHGLR